MQQPRHRYSTGLLVDDRLLFCFDPPQCSAFGRPRFVSSVRDLNAVRLLVPSVHRLVLPICPSLIPHCGYRSILRLSFNIQPFHPLRVFRQLTGIRIQTVPVYLIDKNILAFL